MTRLRGALAVLVLAALALAAHAATPGDDDPTDPARAAALAAVAPDAGASAAARARTALDAAWDELYARLRRRPGPAFALLLRRAELLGLDRAELDLLCDGPAAHRATLERLVRATSGSPLALTFERALTDLAWSDRPLPTLSLAPVPATTGTTSAAPSAGATPAVVLFWTSWSPPARAAHATLVLLSERRPDLPLLAVSLDETEHLPDATLLLRPSTIVETYAPGAWDSAVARALSLRTRGVPLYLVVAPDGKIRRATVTPTFLETWIRRSGR